MNSANSLFHQTLLLTRQSIPPILTDSMPKRKRKKKTVSTAHLDGDRKAKAKVEHQLQRIMKSIDREEDSKGKLPHGCIRRIYEEEKRTLEWLSIHQIYGHRRRKAEKIKRRRGESRGGGE